MDTKPFIIKKITLRASNISVMRNFYENLLQFHVISETDSSVSYAFREMKKLFSLWNLEVDLERKIQQVYFTMQYCFLMYRQRRQ